MTIPPDQREPLVFRVKRPRVFQIVAIGYIAVALLGAGYISLVSGPQDLRNTPGLWLLALLGAGSVLGALLSAFPQLNEGRLEIRRDSVRFVPCRMDQYLSGKQVTEAPVTRQSTEILLCHNFLEDTHVGYAVVVRGPDESEQEIRLRFFKQPDAQDCRGITEDLGAATGLPVRQVIRRSVNGTVHQTPWTPTAPKERRVISVALLTYAILPYVGGITAGFLQLRLVILVAVGLVLWIGQMLGVYAFTRWQRMPEEPSLLRMVASVFTFGTAYGLGVIGVFILRTH